MGCLFSSFRKSKVNDPPPMQARHGLPITHSQDLSTRPPQNPQMRPAQGYPSHDPPSRPHRNPTRTRSLDPLRSPPQDPPRQPQLHDLPGSPTPPPMPDAPPPPYSASPPLDPQPSTLHSQTWTRTLSIENPQTSTPIPTMPPPRRSPSFTSPVSLSIETEPSHVIGSAATPPPDVHSSGGSQTAELTTNPSTVVISLPQDPRDPIRDAREQHIVETLKATLRLISTTLDKISSPTPRVQNFVEMTVGVVNLIEISPPGHEPQEIYNLMQDINAQFVALIDHSSIPEDLQGKIDSIASNTNEFAPPQLKSSKGRALEHSQIAGVAQFLRCMKDELDSQASHWESDRVPSTSVSGCLMEVPVTHRQLEGRMSAKVHVQPSPTKAHSPTTIVLHLPSRDSRVQSHASKRAASTSASGSLPEMSGTLQQPKGGVNTKVDMKPRPMDASSLTTTVPHPSADNSHVQSHEPTRATRVSTSGSASGHGVQVTVQFEGVLGVKIDVTPRPIDAPSRSPMTIAPPAIPPPPPPADSHKDPKRDSLPRCPPISPIEIPHSFLN
ncbi:hypothetical protein IW261DRAFT_1613533 [Armillaria novae-zelandiae]|uniref:Uncharacterized protein n=1 Tax=Armillaria novae-zelandiae TaxID=153914 RepID=A0AA39NEF4_9AGAR|nr:hypothetical protein IW261DRAFT_1613533 [Armillaria novae-zelandiae]